MRYTVGLGRPVPAVASASEIGASAAAIRSSSAKVRSNGESRSIFLAIG